jgi:uncharacterized protein YggT (Ycf19 family)
MCTLDRLIVDMFRVYSVLLLIYALISWVPDLRGAWVRYLAMVIEPVLNPIRRLIPPLGGFDIAFLVLLLLINMAIVPLLERAAFSACSYG